MISFNNSDWLIPITQYYFYIIYIWAYNSGMQIEDLAPFNLYLFTCRCYLISNKDSHVNLHVTLILAFPSYRYKLSELVKKTQGTNILCPHAALSVLLIIFCKVSTANNQRMIIPATAIRWRILRALPLGVITDKGLGFCTRKHSRDSRKEHKGNSLQMIPWVKLSFVGYGRHCWCYVWCCTHNLWKEKCEQVNHCRQSSFSR